jgi:uncharacterized membrane protein
VDIQRIVKHLLVTHGHVRRAFPRETLSAIEKAIAEVETAHVGEIRFVVEGALDGWPLLKGQSARERALELFSQLRVWDTQHSNGLLIYLLLADRAVEIVADRGIHAEVGVQGWKKVCDRMETAFRHLDYEGGVVGGVHAVAEHLIEHFPPDRRRGNELPDEPVVV